MPFVVENHSSFPHFAFVKSGPDGARFSVLAVRATFDWVGGGDMTIAARQEPVLVADRYDGPAAEGALLQEADLVVGKPRTDVVVVGSARAPSGEPLASWPVALRVGALSRSLRVTGPRYWEHGAFGFRLTPPRPVTEVPLTYRVAYGGTRRRAGGGPGEEVDSFDANPVGVGYKGRFPVDEALWPAPQTEAIDAPIQSLSDQPRPQGLGPIPRWWAPRRALAGSLTVAFVKANPGRMPDDFDWAYYNGAPAELVYPGFLSGDETIDTLGLFPEGQSSSRLPGYQPMAVVSFSGAVNVSFLPKLDTLTVDTGGRRVHATYRLTLPEKLDPRRVLIGFSVPRRSRRGGDVLTQLRRKA